jgi:hypothetical protein
LRQFRIILTEGPIGDPTPAFPANPAFTLPEVRPTGIFQRLIELRDRILAAPAYTDEIGALLGIIATNLQPATPESELKPAISVSQSIGGFKFNVDVTRKGMPAYKIQIARLADPNKWDDAAFATTNPCEVTVPPTDPTHPERIMVRAILLKGNQPTGLPSDIVSVTVNP